MLNLLALFFVGVPPVSALAVSKIAAIEGTAIAVIKYALSRKVHWQTVMYAAIPCIVASYISGRVALNTSATGISLGDINMCPYSSIYRSK